MQHLLRRGGGVSTPGAASQVVMPRGACWGDEPGYLMRAIRGCDFSKPQLEPDEIRIFIWMKAGGGDAASDPITARMLTGLRRSEFSGPLRRQGADEEQDGEVELSLGLSVGGNKRKAGEFLNGSLSLIGSDGDRKCRASLERPNGDGVIRNLPMCVPVPNGSGFSSAINRRAPPAVSDSSRSMPKFANPNFNPNPNHGDKRSASSPSSPQVRGRSSCSSETRSNNSSPNAADQKPREPAIQEVTLKHGTPAAAAAGSSETKVDDHQMPRVMAAGPDGAVTSGFLYRYSETEVSIVCVCHGSSFSPAGFVKHAGGRECSHPLRQIMVVPSLEQR